MRSPTAPSVPRTTSHRLVFNRGLKTS